LKIEVKTLDEEQGYLCGEKIPFVAGLVCIHLLMVLKLGINEWPT